MLKSNGVVSLTREEALKRAALARSDDNHPYGLGRGGRKPRADRPYDANGRVDCSGAVCWFLGIDRLQNFNEEPEFWWSTDSIWGWRAVAKDWFVTVGKDQAVLPGDLLVYPDYKVNGQTKQGHVMMVTKILPGFKRGATDWWKFVIGTHATPSHRTKYGNVIAETNAYAFRARKLADGETIGGTFVRYTKFKEPSTVVKPPGAVRTVEMTNSLDPLIVKLAKAYQKGFAIN